MLLHDFRKDLLQFFPSLPFTSFPILPRYHIYPTIRQAPIHDQENTYTEHVQLVHIHKANVPNLFYEWALHWAPVSTCFKATTYTCIADMQLTYKYYKESHLYSNFYVLCFKLKLSYSVTSRGSSWLQTCLCTAWSQSVWGCGGKIISKGNWRSSCSCATLSTTSLVVNLTLCGEKLPKLWHRSIISDTHFTFNQTGIRFVCVSNGYLNLHVSVRWQGIHKF